MRRAIELASTITEDAVSPNPRVGAVIVERGRIVSESFLAYDSQAQARRVAFMSPSRVLKSGAAMLGIWERKPKLPPNEPSRVDNL